MIINYPTGLYASVLPSDMANGGNVTYTISTQTPPRTDLLYPKIPKALIGKQKQIRPRDLVQRRPTMGDLVFTITKATRSELGNTEKVYETGQILEFIAEPIKTIEPMLVADKTEIVHNVSRINYDGLGIKQTDIDIIESNSLVVYEQLKAKLNVIVEDRKKQEELIITNQKIVNDANRTIQALTLVNNIEYNPDISDIILNTEVKKVAAQKKIDESITIVNKLASQATTILDQIRQIATVIK